MYDVMTRVMAATADKRRYPTLSAAVKDGSNIGIFGGYEPKSMNAEFKEWKLNGDCIEFRPFGSEGDWSIAGNSVEIFEHQFSCGIWGAYRVFVSPSPF